MANFQHLGALKAYPAMVARVDAHIRFIVSADCAFLVELVHLYAGINFLYFFLNLDPQSGI